MSLSFLLLLLLLLLLTAASAASRAASCSSFQSSTIVRISTGAKQQQIEHDEGKVVKKPSTQPPKQDAYMVVLSRAVPRSCPCPIGAAKFPPPTRRSERRNRFKPRLRRPLRASKRWNGSRMGCLRGSKIGNTPLFTKDFTH